MNPSHFSLGIKDQTGFYEVSLHEVSKSSKNTVLISGKNYKILGSEPAVSKLRVNMTSSSFENVSEFTASVHRNVKSQEKTEVVFQEIIGQNSNSIGKAEKQFWKWLSTFNSGDEILIREFKQQFKNPENYSEEGNLSFFEDVQGFSFVKIVESSPTQIKVLLQEQCKFQEYALLTLEVEGDEAGKHPLILNMTLNPSSIDHEPVQRMSESEALKAIDSEITRLDEQGQFSGTVLLTKVGNPTPLISRAVGKSNLETQTANTLQTKFNLASMGKMFTAVVIHQLAEEGKIDLKAPIGNYLKTNIGPKLAEVTVEQLLTHTGGTGGLTGDEFHEDMGPKDYMRLLHDREPEFTPGTEWNYSNYGFVLLGAVIEEVSKKSYYECIQERVFDKAGMKDSDFHKKTEEVTNLAAGYIRKRNGLKSNIDALPMRGSPAGGGYSTVEDLNRFANAFFENKLLNAHSIEAISIPKRVTHEDYPASTYTLGFQDGDLWFGHEGKFEGVNGELRIYPKAGYIVTVMGNLDPPAATNLAEFIGARLPA
jgi:D-alanyl-D-alanine carboxypeptidase